MLDEAANAGAGANATAGVDDEATNAGARADATAGVEDEATNARAGADATAGVDDEADEGEHGVDKRECGADRRNMRTRGDTCGGSWNRGGRCSWDGRGRTWGGREGTWSGRGRAKEHGEVLEANAIARANDGADMGEQRNMGGYLGRTL